MSQTGLSMSVSLALKAGRNTQNEPIKNNSRPSACPGSVALRLITIVISE